MNDVNYAHAVSRLRAIETKLLDRAKIDRMIDSNSAEEVFKMLQETDFNTLMGNVKRPEDYEAILSEDLKRLYSLMYYVSPNKTLIDVMSLRYDYHNIKVIIKGCALKKDLDYLLIPVGTVQIEKLKSFIEEKNYYDLEPIMREAIETVDAAFEANKDPQKIDILLDYYMYKDMLSKANTIGEEYLLNFLKINIDLLNLKSLLRVKKQNKSKEFLDTVLLDGGAIDRDNLISMLNESNESIINKLAFTDYGEIVKAGIEEFVISGRLNIFEKLSDNFIMKFIKDAKYISFGVEPLLAFMFAKENEIKLVRIIMVGKLNNINAEVIRERLRDIYV